MKFYTSLTLLILLTLIASCGQVSNGKATLTVSKGFALGDSSFDGGFVVHGLNTQTGEDFSVAVSSGSSTNVNIPFGPWFIRVVGWDDDPDLFEGTVLCDKIPFNFTSDNQTVVLNVTNAKCTDPEFASAGYMNSTNFSTLNVYTCGALLNTTIPDTLKNPTLNPSTLCTGYSKDLQKIARGLKISFNDKLPGGSPTPTLSSICIAANTAASGNPFNTLKTIPTKMPITISLYETDDCNSISFISSNYFEKGLEDTISTRAQKGFDYVVQDTTATIIELFLPSGPSKRASSGFLTESPSFKCTANNTCVSLPASIYLSNQYYIPISTSSQIRVPGGVAGKVCADITAPTNLTVDSCIEKNGDLYLDITASSATSTFDVSAVTQSVLKPSPNDYHIFDKILKTIGVNNTLSTTAGTPNTLDSFVKDDSDITEIYYGELAHVRMLLSPSGLGGLFFDQSCSQTALGTSIQRNMQLYDKGQLKYVRATLTDPPALTIPNYILGKNARDFAAPLLSNYHRRFILQESLSPLSNFVTTHVLDVACDTISDLTAMTDQFKMGRLESQSEKLDGSYTDHEKKVIYWNTSSYDGAGFIPSSSDRFEVYKQSSSYDGSNNLVDQETSFRRAERETSASFLSNTKIRGLDYRGEDTGSIQENLHSFEIDISNASSTIDYKSLATITKSDSTALGDIFTDQRYQGLKNKSQYGFDSFTLQQHELTALSMHSSGKYIHAYRNTTSGFLELDFFNGTTHYTTPPSAVNANLISADMSEDGSKIIIVTNVGANITFWLFNGSIWSSEISIPTSFSTVNNLKTAILNDGTYLVATSGDGGNLKFALSTIGTPPSFSNASVSSDSPAITTTAAINTTELSVKEMALTKDASSFYLSLIILDNNNSAGTYISPFSNYVNTCKMNGSTATAWLCTLKNGHAFGSDVLEKLDSGFYSSTSLSVSFKDVSNSYVNTYVPSTVANLGSFPSASTSSTLANYSAFDYLPTNYSKINTSILGGAAGAGGPIIIPFTAPIHADKYQMNLQGLKPSLFNNIFTPAATFQSTGQ